VKELYPDLLSIKKANIDWDLVSKLARHDEQLHLVATILLGKSPAEICDYFDIGMNAARSKVQRFVARLDSPEHYQDPWTNQVINALGLYKMFGQEPRFTDFGVGLTPINLTDFNTPRFKYDRGDQLSLLLIIPGQKLQDGSELKKTRSLRKVQLDRETTEDGNLQMNFLETLLSDPSGTSLIA
jgi:hypothetical protein